MLNVSSNELASGFMADFDLRHRGMLIALCDPNLLGNFPPFRIVVGLELLIDARPALLSVMLQSEIVVLLHVCTLWAIG